MRIDWWTLGLQTINVAVLVWLLGHFFWRPLAAMIAQRRDTIQATLDDAAAKHAAADAARAEIEKIRAGFAQERDAILAAARETAEQARTARLQEAAKDAETLIAAARDTIETERQANERAWAERAAKLAVAIAERLAARLDGPAVRAAFLDWLLQEIRALPAATRAALLSNGVPIEAVSATPLEPSEEERCRTLIGQALGTRPR